MIADTTESLTVAAICLVILAANLWNARRIDRKHTRENS
jgi:hypothetical protein